MLKRIAILAVAMFWFWSEHTFPGETPSRKHITTSNPRSSSAQRSKASSKTRVVSSKTRRASARRRRWRNPWRVSSFADSAAEDNPTGEDPAVRDAAVEALGNWNGSVVVVDPNTGRILSIVNQKLALESAFTPCSTFKPVVALAALREGLITPDTEIRVGRRTRLALTEALANSNNTFFTKLGQKLGFRLLARYGREFGLGEKAGSGIAGEVPGRFPDQPPKGASVGLMASHGKDIEVTPLQMAAMISAFANGGTLYDLQYPRTEEELAQFEPRVRRRLDDLVEYIPLVKEGLAAAVAYGTARYAYDPEIDIYGKTGTCSENGARLGWFVSYSSEQQPKFVVVVLLRGGRLIYGPHAAEIAGRLYRNLHQREQAATQANGSFAFEPSTQ